MGAAVFLAAAVSWAIHGAGPVVQNDAMPCKACHATIFNSFAQTAHFKTSAEATARSVKGSFTEGRNLLRTRADGTYFKMEQRKGAF